MKDLTREEFKERLKNDPDAVLLDVRTQEEVEEGYIPGARNLDIYKGQEFVEELEQLEPASRVLGEDAVAGVGGGLPSGRLDSR